MLASGRQVVLNVYDLSPQNDYMYCMGFGIYHTGVEVYGIEYSFGGHDYDVSGVFATNPREAPGAVIFRESVPMGETNLSPQQVQALVQGMGQQYKGNRYHLLQRNCNHFANELAQQLTGRPAPFWVNRLAGIAVALHCLLPPGWVPPLSTPSLAPDYVPTAAPGCATSSTKRRAGIVRDASRQRLLAPGNAPAPDEFDPSDLPAGGPTRL